jgi:small multidrug resistance family-3 protein
MAPRGKVSYGGAMATWLQLILMALAAVFEVAGDALIRRGLNTRGIALVLVGFLVLGTYGIVVNLVRLEFSRLLGAYVAWFAATSVVFGAVAFGDRVPLSTFLGLALILSGSLVIQFGPGVSAR